MHEYLCLSGEGHAFNQSLLSRAPRSFIGLILKGRNGSS
jgi:hypothetical protein